MRLTRRLLFWLAPATAAITLLPKAPAIADTRIRPEWHIDNERGLPSAINPKWNVCYIDHFSVFGGPAIAHTTKGPYGGSFIHWWSFTKVEDPSWSYMMTSLNHQSVPVPLRMIYAAGGINIDEVLKQRAEDDLFHQQVLLGKAS